MPVMIIVVIVSLVLGILFQGVWSGIPTAGLYLAISALMTVVSRNMARTLSEICLVLSALLLLFCLFK